MDYYRWEEKTSLIRHLSRNLNEIRGEGRFSHADIWV